MNFFRIFKARRQVRIGLTQDLQPLGIRLSRPGIRFSRSSRFLYDAVLNREGSRYGIDFSNPDCNRVFRRVASARVGTFLYWLWHCPPEVTSITVNLSDGDYPSAARFAASAREPDVVPLPDPFFFGHRGYPDYRRVAETNPVAWSARSDLLRWRGTTSGWGTVDDFSPTAMSDPQVLPRIRAALILRDQPRCDVAFASSNRGEAHAAMLRAHRLLADPIPESDWIGDKFALDIDGYSNTWSNFLVRLHLGCCVIKVASQGGYRQWYYDRIRPWEHFVPVKADMTDLLEKIDWVRTHDAEARAIATNGQSFARSMTFESETRAAVAAICAAHGISAG